ncbi:MAG: ABC transporter substrate-binding protein [Anaeromyxobacteraceae bacterium]
MALSRRRFVATAGGAVLALGSAGLAPRPARAQRKTLRIIQWSHFVPGYDTWFDGTFCKAWGEKHGTDVKIDHISIGEIGARAAAEVSAQRGHDLFMFLSPPAAYGNQVIDHAEIYEQVAQRHGRAVDLAHKSTFDPKARKYFAFSASYVPDPGHYRQDLWAQVGYPRGPDSWEDVRKGARAIREKLGNPCGLGLSQELDSNMALRSLLWSFGGSVQDEAGKVVLSSPQTIEALKFMRAIHQESQTPEVFTWDPGSNNRGILSGKLSYVTNAISIARTAEKDDPALARKLQLVRAPKGPARRIAAEHVVECYAIWKFAENKDGAKQFLADYVDAFADAFKASELYNLPCFPQTVPDLA